MNVPKIASRSAIERWEEYDMVGYIEDDILIEDSEFFQKVKFFHENCLLRTNGNRTRIQQREYQ